MYITFEEMKELAAGIVEYFSTELQVSLGYDGQSVQWIDGYIARNRDIFTEDYLWNWSVAFGFIVGETMVREYGGDWIYDEKQDQWLIKLKDSLGQANPIGKTYKHMIDEYEGLESFFNTIGVIIESGGIDKL